MDVQDCIKFASENPLCYLATTDGDQPRVRAILLWFADENGFYFGTLSPKNMSKQMHLNPRVEICFYNNPKELGDARQMRLTGALEFINDEILQSKMLKDREFLAQIVGRSLDDVTEIFRLASGEAHFWTMADVLREPDLERIKF